MRMATCSLTPSTKQPSHPKTVDASSNQQDPSISLNLIYTCRHREDTALPNCTAPFLTELQVSASLGSTHHHNWSASSVSVLEGKQAGPTNREFAAPWHSTVTVNINSTCLLTPTAASLMKQCQLPITNYQPISKWPSQSGAPVGAAPPNVTPNNPCACIGRHSTAMSPIRNCHTASPTASAAINKLIR